MKNRIKEIRKNKNLTQSEFADLLGLKGNTITSYETGIRVPSEAVIKAICREFNVNENWLRTGEGEMFAPLDREQEIAKMTLDLLKEEKDSFKFRLIKALMNLSPEKWTLLEDIACEIAQKKD